MYNVYIFSTHKCISIALEAVQNTLTNMSTSVTALQMSSNSLNSTLQNISESVSELRASCDSAALIGIDCMVLDPSVFQNGLGADYNQV